MYFVNFGKSNQNPQKCIYKLLISDKKLKYCKKYKSTLRKTKY